MIRLTRKMLYAIEAVVDIAYHGGGEPVQSRDITARQGTPRRYLEQALQQLVREGILVGVRGPRGGYHLARERRRISLGDIVRVIRNLETAEDPLNSNGGSPMADGVIRPLWTELQEEFMSRLDSVTIDELCARANDSGVMQKNLEPLSEDHLNVDFSI